MKKFVRLDTVGEWRGTEHVSSVGVSSFVSGHEQFEEGVSCYELSNDGPAHAFESLFEYWNDTVMLKVNDYKNMQITVFEGEQIDGMGSDYEDLAICKRTIKEVPAYDIMKELIETYYEYHDYDELTDEEYINRMNDIYNKIMEG